MIAPVPVEQPLKILVNKSLESSNYCTVITKLYQNLKEHTEKNVQIAFILMWFVTWNIFCLSDYPYPAGFLWTILIPQNGINNFHVSGRLMMILNQSGVGDLDKFDVFKYSWHSDSFIH